MASTAYASGTGNCIKCGQQLLQIEGGESEQGERVCVMCQGKKTSMAPSTVGVVDPGEAELNRVLAGARVAGARVTPRESATKSVAPTPAQANPQQTVVVNVQPGQSFEHLIGEALKIMESLPMPRDIKQFKAVNKIVTAMKALVEVPNGD